MLHPQSISKETLQQNASSIKKIRQSQKWAVISDHNFVLIIGETQVLVRNIKTMLQRSAFL